VSRHTWTSARNGGAEFKFVREPFRIVDETGARLKPRSSHV